MYEIDLTRFKTTPYKYQPATIRHILKNPAAAVFDEQGVGKGKPVVDAACILYEAGDIGMVVVVSPASVRAVWDEDENGEISKHCWKDYIAVRYDANYLQSSLPTTNNQLLWVTVSYSYLRARLPEFIKLVAKTGKPFLLVFDESSYVKSHHAQQSKAAWKLRQLARRCVLLNGTPYANSIMDLWMQFNILEPKAIKHMNYFHYRAKYAVMATGENKKLGTKFQKIVGFKEDKVKELLADLDPYIIRREKKDVIKDLPPKLPPVFLEAQMSVKGWKIYEDMEEEMVSWLSENEYSSSANAAVKSGRLSQITSGFLGGVKSLTDSGEDDEMNVIQEVDRAKLDTYLEFRAANPDKQIIIWCRFRAEMFRLHRELEKAGYRPGLFMGGMKEDDRTAVKNGFIRGDITDFIGHPLAGGFGLTLVNCHTVVYMSLSHSLLQFQQSSDRVHRPGQKMPVSYYFILATSPRGRKTVDHLTAKAVSNKEDMAKWTTSHWKKAIEEL